MQKQEKEPEVSTNRVQVAEGSQVDEGRQFLVEAVVTSADSLWAMPKMEACAGNDIGSHMHLFKTSLKPKNGLVIILI